MHINMSGLETFFYKKYVLDRPIHKIHLCGRRVHDVTINTKNHEVIFRCQPAHRGAVADQGVDPDHIIAFARDWIEGLNKQVYCRENDHAIEQLNLALDWLQKRREDRISRNVEGEFAP